MHRKVYPRSVTPLFSLSYIYDKGVKDSHTFGRSTYLHYNLVLYFKGVTINVPFLVHALNHHTIWIVQLFDLYSFIHAYSTLIIKTPTVPY